MEYFEQLRQPANRLLKEVRGNPDADQHPAFLGKGWSASVFRFDTGDGEYALRVPHGSAVDPFMIDHYIAGSVYTQDIPHIEQIRAASYEEGVTVADFIPGKPMAVGMPIEDIKAIRDDQLSDFLDTVITAYQRNVEIDFKPTNVHYDREGGFYIVDCGSACIASEGSEYSGLGDVVATMQSPIMQAGMYHDDVSKVIDDEEFLNENLRVLERFIHIVEDTLEGDDRDEAVRELRDTSSQHSRELTVA